MRNMFICLAMVALAGCDLGPANQADAAIVGTYAWYNQEAAVFCGGRENILNMKFNRTWGGYHILCTDMRSRDI